MAARRKNQKLMQEFQLGIVITGFEDGSLQPQLLKTQDYLFYQVNSAIKQIRSGRRRS